MDNSKIVDIVFSYFHHYEFLDQLLYDREKFHSRGENITLLCQLNMQMIIIVYYICQYLTIIKSEKQEIILLSFAYVTDLLLIYVRTEH